MPNQMRTLTGLLLENTETGKPLDDLLQQARTALWYDGMLLSDRPRRSRRRPRCKALIVPRCADTLCLVPIVSPFPARVNDTSRIDILCVATGAMG